MKNWGKLGHEKLGQGHKKLGQGHEKLGHEKLEPRTETRRHDSCPLVLGYPVTGGLESLRLSSDLREED